MMSPAVEGVVSAFLLVLFSEVGDKTFFVALLLSLQNSKAAVFAGWRSTLQNNQEVDSDL